MLAVERLVLYAQQSEKSKGAIDQLQLHVRTFAPSGIIDLSERDLAEVAFAGVRATLGVLS